MEELFEKLVEKAVEVATEEPRGHKQYVRTVRGKTQTIPQKGSTIKEREKIEKPKKEEVRQKPEEVLHGEEHQQFTKLLDQYFHASEEVKMMTNLIDQHKTELESVMSEIRPMLAKFDNLEKAENKFRTEFKEGDWDYKFLSFSRESKPYKDLYTKAFNLLNDMQKSEMKTAEEALKKITAQEKFGREAVKKALSYIGKPLDELGNFYIELSSLILKKAQKIGSKVKVNPDKDKKNDTKEDPGQDKTEEKESKKEPKKDGTYQTGIKKRFVTSVGNLLSLRERAHKLLEEFFSRSNEKEKEKKPKNVKTAEKEEEKSKALISAVTPLVVLKLSDVLEKAEVKPYTRTRMGKVEKVQGYNRKTSDLESKIVELRNEYEKIKDLTLSENEIKRMSELLAAAYSGEKWKRREYLRQANEIKLRPQKLKDQLINKINSVRKQLVSHMTNKPLLEKILKESNVSPSRWLRSARVKGWGSYSTGYDLTSDESERVLKLRYITGGSFPSEEYQRKNWENFKNKLVPKLEENGFQFTVGDYGYGIVITGWNPGAKVLEKALDNEHFKIDRSDECIWLTDKRGKKRIIHLVPEQAKEIGNELLSISKLEKARTPGAKDIKPRKRRVILNPDYVALGPKEFRKLREQDPDYKYGKQLTEEELAELTSKFNEI
jgi:hypothetical protein